jgi:mRNA interferase RelE/StbE
VSSEYAVYETAAFSKSLKKLKLERLQTKLQRTVYPQLQKAPQAGPQIKKLKGEFPYLYRYRVGKYRIMYLIDDAERAVYLTDIQHRKNAYRK